MCFTINHLLFIFINQQSYFLSFHFANWNKKITSQKREIPFIVQYMNTANCAKQIDIQERNLKVSTTFLELPKTSYYSSTHYINSSEFYSIRTANDGKMPEQSLFSVFDRLNRFTFDLLLGNWRLLSLKPPDSFTTTTFENISLMNVLVALCCVLCTS